MPSLTIASNRLPISVRKNDGQLEFYPSVGGLATGLSSFTKDKNCIWVGWPGISADELSSQEMEAITNHLAGLNCRPVFLNSRQLEAFYNGYSNSILWPLLHSSRFNSVAEERDWRTYR
jgi:trehalose 6-phosphate synthase/phosphatase